MRARISEAAKVWRLLASAPGGSKQQVRSRQLNREAEPAVWHRAEQRGQVDARPGLRHALGHPQRLKIKRSTTMSACRSSNLAYWMFCVIGAKKQLRVWGSHLLVAGAAKLSATAVSGFLCVVQAAIWPRPDDRRRGPCPSEGLSTGHLALVFTQGALYCRESLPNFECWTLVTLESAANLCLYSTAK